MKCLFVATFAAVIACSSPPRAKAVFLLGRFITPFNRGWFTQRLEASGYRVLSEFRASVDLVVLGGDPISDQTDVIPLRHSPEYLSAVAHNIKMIGWREMAAQLEDR